MYLWGRHLWLDTWSGDVSAEQQLSKLEKNRWRFRISWYFRSNTLPPEMAWVMSKEESSGKGIPERTSHVSIPHLSRVLIQATQMTASHDGWHSILYWHGHEQLHPCHYLGNRRKEEYFTLFLEIWSLSKTLQPAGSPHCFSKMVELPPMDKWFAETFPSSLGSQEPDDSKVKNSEIKSKLNSNRLACLWSQQ